MTLAGLKAAFHGLPQRERRALLLLAVFVVLAAMAQTIWSAHEATARLRSQLPVLENKAALMRHAEKSVQDHRAKPAVRVYEGEPLLQRTLELAKPRIAGLPVGAITLEGARGIAFQASVSFDAWIEFVATAHRELALRLVSSEIGADGGGRVQVRAKFALADPAS